MSSFEGLRCRGSRYTISLQTCELGDESSFPPPPRACPPPWLTGHQRGQVSGIAADGREASRPPGDRKSFLPWTYCVVCASVSSRCPRCRFFFVANPELLTTACFPFGVLLPSAVQPCSPPFQNLGFISDFLRFLMDFPGGSAVKTLPANAGDAGSIPGSGRSPGEGNGNLPQCSCLENPMGRGAWWATVQGLTKSRT